MKEYLEEELIQASVNQYLKKEHEQIEEELKNIDEKFIQMTQNDQKMEKLIRKEFRKKNRNLRFLPFYKVATVAAVLLLVLNIFVLTVPAVRNATVGFINYVSKEFTDIGKSTKEEATQQGTYRDDLEGLMPEKVFQITYLPEGMALVDYAVSYKIISYNYLGEENQNVSFYQESQSVSTRVDTEDASVTTISIHGIDAVLAKKEEQTIIVYEKDEYVFRLMSTGITDETLIKMAESIREK